MIKNDSDPRLEAYGLHLAGVTYRRIAERVGVTEDEARRIVRGELDQHLDRNDLIATELARLDELLLPLWQLALNGDLLAIDRILKISERRSALLKENDHVLINDGGESGVDEFTRRLRERQSGTEAAGPAGS